MTTINAILRDGNNVDMPALRSYLAGLEARNAAQDAILANGTIAGAVEDRIYATQSALFADLVPADGEAALVTFDPDPLKNGIYIKNGATTAGDWDGPSDLFASVASDAAVSLAAQINESIADVPGMTLALGQYLDAEPTISSGYFNSGSGSFVSSSSWTSYEVDDGLAGQWFALTMVVNSPIMAAGIFLDAEGDVIGTPAGPGPGSGATYYERLLVQWPEGAVSLRGSAPVDPTTVDGVERRGGVLVERVLLSDERVAEVRDVLGVAPFVRKVWAPASGYYNTNGALVTADVNDGWQQEVFEIAAGQALRLENVITKESITRAIVWGAGFDSGTGAFARIVGTEGAGGSVDAPLPPTARIAPPGTTHVAITTRGIRNVGVWISEVSASAARANNDTINLLNPLRGKTAVWFGTSIPAGGGITGSHVTYIAEALGMTITNEAIGGSAARGGVAARRTTGDTYGWTGASYANLRVAMGKSDAECTDLIDNWVSKWRDRVIGTKPAASALSSDEQAVIRGTSYETILDRHLGDGDRKDYYIFDHGFNDWAWAAQSESSPGVTSNLNDLDTVPGTRFDRATFIGAMEFYMNRIWADNSKARIILIGHFDNDRVPNIAAGQELLAFRTKYPLFKLWEKMGWSQQVIVGGADNGKTLYEVWLPDEVHPFSDDSGQARDLLASLIARWLAANA
ncbi:hypothetical protein [Microcystis phage Mae-JY04]|uniref:hypothetical protein n=1 Tax=Blastomonas sp. TaxID=1909299 RepID=UPI00258492F3|nr:hypothetical protein [Blastomonas sp.]